MTEILMTIAVMNALVLVLTGLILLVRANVVTSGEAIIKIAGREGAVHAKLGDKLLAVLIESGIGLPAACGGKGTCGLCVVRVTGELDPPHAMERAVVDDRRLARNLRLACQVTVRGDLDVRLIEPLVEGGFEAAVRSVRNLTVLIKEIVFEIPDSVDFEFRAGSFVQVTCPRYRVPLGELPIDAAYRADWRRLGVDELIAVCEQPATRAYSLANHRGEGRIAKLVVRLALPPPGTPAGTPPGQVSSYLFSVEPGDSVKIAGPFGHFIANDSDKEMLFVGGGVGMAPLRAHVFEQLEVLHTGRKMSFWYGARSRKELIYCEEFERLAGEHQNFSWHVALSEPDVDDSWQGPTGFIHEHLLSAYLADHPAPADCEYYLCGPPLMIRAVVAMLGRLGVPSEAIFFDDFGG